MIDCILIVLAVIVFFVFAFLFLPVNIHFKYLEKINLRVRWLCFSFNLLRPKKEKKKLFKKRKKVKKQKKNKIIDEEVKRANLRKEIQLASEILKGLKSPLKKFCKRIKIRGLMIEISVGADDAAKTALQFGIISAAIFGLLTLIDEIFNLKSKQISLYPDFLSEETKSYIEFNVKVTFLSALCFILSIDHTKGTELLKLFDSNQ